jgi:hypothetical protein
MAEYLSTDPNAGLETEYLSTDPNAGLEAPSQSPVASLDAFMPPSAMSPQEEKQSVVDAAQQYPGIEKAAKGLVHNVQPFIEHPLSSAYNMVVPNAQDFQNIYALTKPETYQRNLKPGSQEYYDQVVGNALPLALMGASMFKGRAAPADAAVRESMAKPEPAAAPDPPPVPDWVRAADDTARQAKVQQGAAAGRILPESKEPSLIEPVTRNIRTEPEPQPLRSQSEIGADFARMTPDEMAEAYYRATGRELPKPETENLHLEPAAATIPKANEFTPEQEPRPADQALVEPSGQQPAAPEQPSSVEAGQAPETLGERGQEYTGGTAGTSNRVFSDAYGVEGVPSGTGVDTVQLLDSARADVRSGNIDPYSVLSKTKAKGIANPEEYAALAAEHERLVNDAVAKEKAGDPAAQEAAQTANDFANAIQPHKTAASDLFRLFQGDVNYDLSTGFGMDQYMKAELGRNMKPTERPVFEQRARGIRQAETGVQEAVARSDVKVQGRYRNVRDIPMEEAAARIREQLKPCQV